MAAPTVDDAIAYLGDTSWTAEAISSAFAAEKASQAVRCRVPADDAEWPEDLAEALCRRVQHNLALRQNPLGLETALSEFGSTSTRVGGLDAEVRRLEGPWRRVSVG